MKLFKYKQKLYPTYLKNHNASKFILEFAKEYCLGKGVNIGYGNNFSKIFDRRSCLFLDLKDGINCNKIDFIEKKSLDFVFSSHTLEHMNNWKISLKNWVEKIKQNGWLFLYLPHYKMEYWKPKNNKKHKSLIYPNKIKKELYKIKLKYIFISGIDLFYSYCVVAKK